MSRRRAVKRFAFVLVCILVLAARRRPTWWCGVSGFSKRSGQAIVNTVEDATGGRAEIGSFRFDWKRLRADVADLRAARDGAAGQAAPVSRHQCRGRSEDRLAPEARRRHPVPGRRGAARLPDRQSGRQHQHAAAEDQIAARRQRRRDASQARYRTLQPAERHLRSGSARADSHRRPRPESECAPHLRASGAALSRRNLDPAPVLSLVRLRARAG